MNQSTSKHSSTSKWTAFTIYSHPKPPWTTSSTFLIQKVSNLEHKTATGTPIRSCPEERKTANQCSCLQSKNRRKTWKRDPKILVLAKKAHFWVLLAQAGTSRVRKPWRMKTNRRPSSKIEKKVRQKSHSIPSGSGTPRRRGSFQMRRRTISFTWKRQTFWNSQTTWASTATWSPATQTPRASSTPIGTAHRHGTESILISILVKNTITLLH